MCIVLLGRWYVGPPGFQENTWFCNIKYRLRSRARDCVPRSILAPTRARPAFRKLQRLPAATTFSHVWLPFCRRGITWSRIRSWTFLPQYWQAKRSCRNTSLLGQLARKERALRHIDQPDYGGHLYDSSHRIVLAGIALSKFRLPFTQHHHGAANGTDIHRDIVEV